MWERISLGMQVFAGMPLLVAICMCCSGPEHMVLCKVMLKVIVTLMMVRQRRGGTGESGFISNKTIMPYGKMRATHYVQS